MSGKPKGPTLSGYCNPSWPLTDPSHQRCRKADCPCEHHAGGAVEPLRWDGDDA